MLAAEPSGRSRGGSASPPGSSKAGRPPPADAYETLLGEAKACRSVRLQILRRKWCSAKDRRGARDFRRRTARRSGGSSGPSIRRPGGRHCCDRRFARRDLRRRSATSPTRSSISNSRRAASAAFTRRRAPARSTAVAGGSTANWTWWSRRSIVTLGASALRAIAGPSARLGEMRGRTIAIGRANGVADDPSRLSASAAGSKLHQ